MSKRNKDSIGDRMKRYEEASNPKLSRRCNIIVRVDGKAFHSYTRSFVRPFDPNIVQVMQSAATYVARDMCGFKLAYVQSDEASFLLTDYDEISTQAWFDNNLSKIVSIAASNMTAYFNDQIKRLTSVNRLASFDARAFIVPASDVANYFLWRAKDWSRNSLSMYARSFYSAKQLLHKSNEQQHEMLHEKGKNWTKDLSPQLRNGTFIYYDPNRKNKKENEAVWVVDYGVKPTFLSVSALVDQLLPKD